MAEPNRLLRSDIPSSLGDALYQTGRNALLYPFRNPEATAEFGLGMAPGSGEAMSARDAWNASGRGGNALLGGNYGEAASEYGNMATGLLGALPGAGIIARGTKRGAAWMDRNVPGAVNRLLDGVTPQNMQDVAPAFPAWHGSPHDFDEFKLDKIGTGEGAQAYGHGLYFAENPTVARQYRDDLSTSRALSVEGADYNALSPGAKQYAAMAARGDDLIAEKARLEKLLADLDARASGGDPYGYVARDRNSAARSLDELSEVAGKKVTANQGRLYHTEIDAEPHQLLDWDKPLSQQGEIGEKALAVFERLGIAQSGRWKPDTLAGIKQLATENYGRDSFDAASKALREAGIPGIRYLDQGSRGADGGTSNYVIFDDKLVKIQGKE